MANNTEDAELVPETSKPQQQPVATTEIAKRSAGGAALDRALEAGQSVSLSFTDSAGWELAQRVATAFSRSTMVPQRYQNNLPNCMIALEMAHRIGASPLMVMQNLYVVKGNVGWSSAFLIACVNQSGKMSTTLKYEWAGTKQTDSWSCRAWALDKHGERVEGPEVTFGMAKAEGWVSKEGSKWKTMPELMMTYRAAAFFARTNTPELTMGLQTAEEVSDVVGVQINDDEGRVVSAGSSLEDILSDIPEEFQAKIREVLAIKNLNSAKTAVLLKRFAGKPAELLAELTAKPSQEAAQGRTDSVETAVGTQASKPVASSQKADLTPAAGDIF